MVPYGAIFIRLMKTIQQCTCCSIENWTFACCAYAQSVEVKNEASEMNDYDIGNVVQKQRNAFANFSLQSRRITLMNIVHPRAEGDQWTVTNWLVFLMSLSDI